jgi:hypothetical protein
MASLASQSCLHHPAREAVARCPECGRFYCRECITEHEDRVICAGCLRGLTGTPEKRKPRLGGVLVAGRCAFGFLVAWMFFYFIARALVSIPSTFHEGTLWSLIDPTDIGKERGR